MEKLFAVLSVVAILVLAGCASQPQVTSQPENKSTGAVSSSIPSTEQKNTASPSEVAQGQPRQEPKQTVPAETAADDGTCAVQFQKDSSSVYYIMVRTSSQKQLEVSCPNGKAADKRGELFFCAQLDIPSPIIAYLDGVECGRADFTKEQFVKKAPSKIACTISLSSTRLTIGQSTEVTVQTSSGEQEINVSFNCGEKIVSKIRSGLTTDGAMCTYGNPGTYDVSATVDGEVCASKPIEVFEKPRECFLLSNKFIHTFVKNQHVYLANVSARGYSGSDFLSYSCFGIPYQLPVREIQNPTDFIKQIECKGDSELTSGVKVKVGGDLCGEASP